MAIPPKIKAIPGRLSLSWARAWRSSISLLRFSAEGVMHRV